MQCLRVASIQILIMNKKNGSGGTIQSDLQA